MSIYPVPIKEWYLPEDKAFHKELDSLKSLLPYLKCEVCEGKITLEEGHVMHSITFGGPNGAWCSEKCLKEG